MRWWRAYDDAVDDAKLCLLSDEHHRAWFNLCCISSQNGGALPPIVEIAFKLRTKVEKARRIVAELAELRLIDIAEDGTATMHNWEERQFKTDALDPTNAERQKRYRRRYAVTANTVMPEQPERYAVTANTVTPKRPESESESESERKEEPGPVGPPRDIRKELFTKGLKTLEGITGKTPDSCRSLIGKLLKSVNDEAIHVLGAIEDAERNRVADPVAWITQALKSHGHTNVGQRTVQQASRDLIAKFGDMPAVDGSGTDRSSVRLLPTGRRK
jgi:hypothetical protein